MADKVSNEPRKPSTEEFQMGTKLTIDYGDGSKKHFDLRGSGLPLAALMGMASATAADLRFTIWPDRGMRRILAMQIDGHGHPAPGRWVLTRNGEQFWPTVDEFHGQPLPTNDVSIVFTLEREEPASG
jgi:hypothetical protein